VGVVVAVPSDVRAGGGGGPSNDAEDRRFGQPAIVGYVAPVITGLSAPTFIYPLLFSVK
jgi:hypothetical protein